MVNDRRQNQDEYDKIQAQQEYESMHLPHFETYDHGGEFLPPDFTVVENDSGEPISVLTLAELQARLDMLMEEYEAVKRQIDDLDGAN